MKRKSIKGIFMKPMDPAGGDPVIEDNSLPPMPGNDTISSKIKDTNRTGPGLMDEELTSETNSVNRGAATMKLMAPFVAGGFLQDSNTAHKESQMERKTEDNSVSDFYLVFSMQVQNGIISVTGAKKVAGKLVSNESILPGGLTYEATIKDRRLNLGSIPDFGEQRSSPMPDGSRGHHITELPGFTFRLKIPGNGITLQELSEINVALYRLKEELPPVSLKTSRLHEQFPKEIRVVAELQGITLEKMNEPDQTMLRNLLP